MTLDTQTKDDECLKIEFLPITAIVLNASDPNDVYWERIDEPTKDTDDNTDGRV